MRLIPSSKLNYTNDKQHHLQTVGKERTHKGEFNFELGISSQYKNLFIIGLSSFSLLAHAVKIEIQTAYWNIGSSHITTDGTNSVKIYDEAIPVLDIVIPARQNKCNSTITTSRGNTICYSGQTNTIDFHPDQSYTSNDWKDIHYALVNYPTNVTSSRIKLTVTYKCIYNDEKNNYTDSRSSINYPNGWLILFCCNEPSYIY